jgi:hypothetical protein
MRAYFEWIGRDVSKTSAALRPSSAVDNPMNLTRVKSLLMQGLCLMLVGLMAFGSCAETGGPRDSLLEGERVSPVPAEKAGAAINSDEAVAIARAFLATRDPVLADARVFPELWESQWHVFFLPPVVGPRFGGGITVIVDATTGHVVRAVHEQ